MTVDSEECVHAVEEGPRLGLLQQLAQRPFRPRGKQDLAHAWPAPRVLREPPEPAAHLRGEDAFRARGEQRLGIGPQGRRPAADERAQDGHPGQETH
jgi:hypothetical protein